MRAPTSRRLGSPPAKSLSVSAPKAGGEPGLHAADHVGCVESEALQGGRGETRLIALVADQDHPAALGGEIGVAVRAAGVEAPLEDVPGDHVGARNQAVALALLERADVDQERALPVLR